MARKIKGNLTVENDHQVDGNLKLPSETASRALQIDGSGNAESSAVTTTELGYVSGVTSAIQTQLDDKQETSEKGNANGYASLDGSGKIPTAQLPSSVMEYKGAWNATTNSPTLVDATGTNGDIYRASVAGTQDFGSGNQTFAVGDLVIYNGSIWEKSPAGDAVTSVFSRTGAVVAAASDYDADQIDFDNGASGLSATDVQAAIDEVEGRVDTLEGASTQIKVSSNDTTAGYLEDKIVIANGTNTTNPLEASTLNDGADEDLQIRFDETKVDHDLLSGFVSDEHIDHTSVSIGTAADSGLTGGGTIAADRDLSVDIDGTTAETTADDADTILIYDDTASALRKMTRANFVGAPGSSSGDISETSFAGANNVSVAANVTGLAFANGTVRSFKVHGSILADGTADLFEEFELHGIQRGADWVMDDSRTGDDSQVTFTITSAGQVQYTSGNYTGFVSLTIKFRAITTSV